MATILTQPPGSPVQMAPSKEPHATMASAWGQVTFGKTGVEKIHPVGTLNSYEEGRLKEASHGGRGVNQGLSVQKIAKRKLRK